MKFLVEEEKNTHYIRISRKVYIVACTQSTNQQCERFIVEKDFPQFATVTVYLFIKSQ